MEKDVLQLDGVWQFKEFPESARRMSDLENGGWMRASVPASVYTCLIEAGIIEPRQLSANPENFQWVSEKSWIFRAVFDVPQQLLNAERIRLIFDGLDTVCQIWINDKLLGKTDNMFIPYVFDVTSRLRASGNVLMIKFSPALRYAEQLMQRYGRLSEHHFGDVRRSYLRKAQYQFGSVMGPPLVGCGLFRSVRLEGVRISRIENVHVRTVDCNQHFADVRVGVAVERINNNQKPLQGKIILTGGGLDIVQRFEFSPQEDRHTALLHIDRPFLWWPNGYGVQHLYHLRIELYQDTELLDTAETRIGIRSIRLNRSSDKTGTKFQFVVNDQSIQVKGANWMPLSMLPGRSSRDDYEPLLRQAVDAHFNMLRVWGGGYYEADDFYQLCDELGILVWQDFMFASAYYPDRHWFKKLVHDEIEHIIERLRNHPSLALWCGNSRIDSLHEAGRLGKGRKFYGRSFYHSMIPSLLSELDPDREYIPTTPFSDTHPATDHQDPASGTFHSWQVWNRFADSADYETPADYVPRFVTEFGLQSLPKAETLAEFGPNELVKVGSYWLEKHNYQPGGQQRLARYIADNFVPDDDLNKTVWRSQITQARAVKRYVEHLRSHNSINSGCLVWTYNDVAPAISFSMIDASQQPKAVYYYAKRFFAPVLITLTPTSYMGPHHITVINDGPHRLTATLNCQLLTFDGTVCDEIGLPAAVSPYSRSPLYPVPKSFLRGADPRIHFLYLQMSNQTDTLAENYYFFEPDKYLQYGSRNIELEIHPQDTDRLRIDVQAKTVVRDLCIIPPAPGCLSDNFMTLLPGRSRRIEIKFDGPAPAIQTPLKILSIGH